MASGRAIPVDLVELRVLDGPNLYFPRPAIKLTVSVPGWLRASEGRFAARAQAVAGGDGSRSRWTPPLHPGPPRSEHRRRVVARMAITVARALADATGASLAVRARGGPEPEQIVVAFPWRRREAARAFGREVVRLLRGALDGRRPFSRLLAESAARLANVEPGQPPSCPDPTIPVIAVTGTNGKTTSVRLLAHLGRTAGLLVAYSSTDGVYFQEDLVEVGDYSGFGGAALALSQPGVQLAVLETARGGILLRGIGTLHNDVSLVTNVSADHLGLHGIRTLDQLAEVKAAITRITRRQGWHVLNADDPRVLAMRRGARGRPWLFSRDSDHPALRSSLEEGGRAITVVDDTIVMLRPGAPPELLLALEDVPVTLAGVSRHNIQNALGSAAAALAAGLPPPAVIEGLASFVMDPETNPARANLFEVDGRILILDYAHNEEGMRGLVEICRGLRRPGGAIWIAYCTAGDRSDDILHGLGYVAARGADHVAIAELPRYLRGRDRHDLIDRLRAGALDGGAAEVPVFPDEASALQSLLHQARRGDVVAITALGQRPELFAMIQEMGAIRVGPKRVRQLARRARAG